ncbi:DUF2306 domain-containing protein [Nitratireductor sp. XY-223]|uniref:DUF2306 domain-containing protein n=1 Tax=Nitratireductor sp. XY-223 TaxID=2561926 RepID=UPI0010AA4A07|nr:DUF2306 domain-containing protein [Nitratireductor sp. XY-223]
MAPYLQEDATRDGRRKWPAVLQFLAVGALVLLSAPFVLHALHFGFGGLVSDLSRVTHLYRTDGTVSNPAMFGHMVAGAVITLLAPLQLLTVLRRRLPFVHRLIGYVVCCTAVLTAVGGLAYIWLRQTIGVAYIWLRQTIGGPLMDFAFAGYGLCVLAAAIQAVRFARARDFERHRRWALRMFVLAIGSWIYRVHYQLWHLATGGLWTEPGFTGPFDLFQLFAFYVPYLVGLEIYFRLRPSVAVQPAAAE